MYFELLQLYGNYRNIENMNIVGEESIVLGHFDRTTIDAAETADGALDALYNSLLENNKHLCADIQPIVLFRYKKENKKHIHKFKVITFLQIDNQYMFDDIKDFYDYAETSINSIIRDLKDKDYIGNVFASVYMPLSFMNTAIYLYADNLTDICTVVKNLVHMKLAIYQYSVISIPKKDSLLKIKDNIDISVRFIWKQKTKIDTAVDKLETAISKYKEASVNHLIGNNDCLIHVKNEGYKVLTEVFNSTNSNGEPLINNQNNTSVFAEILQEVENTRITISFPDNSVKLLEVSSKKSDYLFNSPILLKGFYCLSPLEYDNTFSKLENLLIEELKRKKEKTECLLKRDINDIIYRIVEFGKFMDVIKKHAINGIATYLFFSMKEPYEMFLEMATRRVEMASSDDLDVILDVIGNVLNEMSSYFGNIFHCNLGFFEERGFYNNIIGLASNVELAYNRYANCICQAILSDSKNEDGSLNIRCSVTSDKEPLICTNDFFEKVAEPKNENKSLVKINIPVSYVFKYGVVSKVIIHEIAHHVGGRNRVTRLDFICKCIASVVADPIIQLSVFTWSDNLSENDKAVIEEFEKTDKYKIINQHLNATVKKVLLEFINENVKANVSSPFFMNDVIDALFYVINRLPQEKNLIDYLAEFIAEFQYQYFEFFEEFFLKSNKYLTKSSTVLSELATLSIKAYNKQFLKQNISFIMEEIVSTKDSTPTLKAKSIKSCYIHIPYMDEFIIYFCNAVSEAYCDLMMITLCKMNFNQYLNLMAEYGKSEIEIISGKDYLSWIRIKIVSRYVDKKLKSESSLPEEFSYFEDLGIFKIMNQYFKGLKPEFDKAYERSRQNTVLANFIDRISKGKEEDCISAIFDMYNDILRPKE